MLPAGFRWTQPYIGASGPPHSLQYENLEVARIHQHVAGHWLATLRRYAPDRSHTVTCTSLEAGIAGCEIYADRHQDEVRAEADRKLAAFKARTRGHG